MKTNEEGKVTFDTEAEVRNYMRIHLSSEAIHKRARERHRTINYDDPMLKYRVLCRAIETLPAKAREGKILLQTMVHCAIEREKLKRLAEREQEPSRKQYFLNQASQITREYVYAWFMKDWGYTFEQLNNIEKKAVDLISDKLSIINIPLTFGEIQTQGGI